MNKKPTTLLLILPYWREDQKQVEKVARLCSDLLPEFAENAEIMLVTRYDAPPPSTSIQIALQQKFNKVHVWKCNRVGDGFPGGCNEMAYGIFNHVLTQRHMNAGFKNIDVLFLLEGDCVLTRPTWLEELIAAWEDRGDGKHIVGTKQDAIPDWSNDHINAVALYDPEITRKFPFLVGGPLHVGWDTYHGPALIPFATDSKLFKLDYKRPSITKEELFAKDFPLVYHGVKDNSALEAVRKKWILK